MFNETAAVQLFEEELEIPDHLLCPITGALMAEPVLATDGQTYEHEAIEAWLKEQGTSPYTRQGLDLQGLRLNPWVIQDLEAFLRQHPTLKRSLNWYLPEKWKKHLVEALKAKELSTVKAWLAQHGRLALEPLEKDYTAFHLAAEFSSPEMVVLIVEHLESQSLPIEACFRSVPLGFKPVHLTGLLMRDVEKGDQPKVAFWLQQGVRIEPELLNLLLEQALEALEEAQAAVWLQLGANLEQPNTAGDHLLARLVQKANLVGTRWLLRQGAALENANHLGNTPLHLSLLHPQLEMATFLWQHEGSQHLKTLQNTEGLTPTALAILSQQKSLIAMVVGTLLASLPPAHLAIVLKDANLLQALLAQDKSSIDALDAQQRTPLGSAIEAGMLECARILLESGADLELPTGLEKQRPLQLAAVQGHTALVSLLLEAKASIHASDQHHNTALHLGAAKGHEAVLAELLEAGADPSARNVHDQTPVEVAYQAHHTKAAIFIEHKVQALKEQSLKEREAYGSTLETPFWGSPPSAQAQTSEPAPLLFLAKSFQRISPVQAAEPAPFSACITKPSGDLDALYVQAQKHLFRGRPESALPLLQQAAEHNDPYAYAMLFLLHKGFFANQKDENKAQEWQPKIIEHLPFFRAQAQAGVIEAHYLLGRILVEGPEHLKNDLEAFQYCLEAAERGHPFAQNNVGAYYEEGIGIAKDAQKAFQWTLRAAKKGSVIAQNNVGIYYKQGTAVLKDEQQAFELFLKAAKQGYLAAELEVAQCYQKGIGVTQNLGRSEEWYHKAEQQAGRVFFSLHLVRARDGSRKAWYFMLVERKKEEAFLLALKDPIIHLEEYGLVLYSAYGEPPADLSEELTRENHLEDSAETLAQTLPETTSETRHPTVRPSF